MLDKSDRFFLLKLAMYAVVLSLPMWYLLAVRWPSHMDYIFHALILKNVSQQVWSGDWYPRWLTDVNAGLGSPVFLFQPPLSYLASILLQWLSPLDRFGLGRFIIIGSFFVFLGGCACYGWLREYFDKKSARYGAAIYITFPYVFDVFYDAFAMAWLAGIMCFPLMLWGATKLAASPLRYGWFYAFAQGILIFAHLPAAFIMSPIAWLYAVITAGPDKRKMVFCCVSAAALLGMMLGSMCLLPYWVNRSNVRYSSMPTGILDFNVNFIRLFYTTGSWFGNFSLSNLLSTLLPLLFCFWEIRKQKPFERNKTQLIFWLAVFIFGMFMLFPISKPVWNSVLMLNYIIFPVRFLTLSFAATVFIIANWLPKLRHAYVYFVLAILSGISTFTGVANVHYTPMPIPRVRNALTEQLMPWSPYITSWMYNAGIRDSLNPPPRFLSVPPYQTITGSAEITKITQTPRTFTFHAHVTSPNALITLHRYYYPGWIVPDTMPPGISIAEHDALLAVNLPMGDYDVEIDQSWFPGEKLGDFLSGVALVIIVGWITVSRRKNSMTVSAQ